MASSVKWGICGSGKICNDFAAALTSCDFPIAAVAASSLEKAEKFRQLFPQTERAHGSYAALAADPGVDIVYIGTVHSCHCEQALMMIEAGKHVLCEKPVALNAKQARKMVEAARAKKVFFMEGMWTRFFPAVIKIRELLAAGAIGEPALFQADFGFRADPQAQSRLFDPSLGGGALLDIGIYPIAAASMCFGCKPPVEVKATGTVSAAGVDETGVLAIHYPTGDATVSYTIRAQTPEEATFIGTSGYIKVESPAHAPTKVVLSRVTGRGESTEETFEFPLPANKGPPLNFPASEGFQYQARAVAAAVAAGKLECDEYTCDETIAIQEMLDEVRRQIGVRYPADE